MYLITKRGLFHCIEEDCDNVVCFVDEPPPRSASSSDFWCEIHCPKDVPEWKNYAGKGYKRYKIKQELVKLENGDELWYPYTWIDGEWKIW